MNTRLAFLLILMLLMFVLPLHAQETPPAQSPTPGGLVYGLDAEILYPEAVRFTIALAANANEFALAVLTIRIEGQEAIVIPISIADAATLREPFTELAYLWDIPRDNLPNLFTDVVYEWQLTRTNDQIIIAENAFEFSDPRLAWTQNTANGSNITFSLPLDSFNISLGSLRSELQSTYDLMRTNTGQQPAFHVMLYPTDLSPGCGTNAAGESVSIGLLSGTEVTCNDAQLQAIYAASGVDVLQLEGVGTENALRFAMADLFVERFYSSAWSTSDVPLWFQRGLALFYLPINKLNLLEPAQRAARGNGLFTLDEMNSEPPQDADVWRAQSYGMVLNITRQIGVDGLYSLARNPGTAFAESYQSAVGQPLSNLISSWQRWLFTSDAADAYAYFPQLPITPTPSFTPTATQPRPTATSTATDTPTVTPSVTNTGLPERILPTITPTRTPTNAPATVTPRPAGSLRTPTPMPTPTATPSPSIIPAGQASNFAGIAIVLLVIAGLSIIYLRQNSRRS